jgi:hypothetical protein
MKKQIDTRRRLHALLIAVLTASSLSLFGQQQPIAVEKEIEMLKARLAELEQYVKSQKGQPPSATQTNAPATPSSTPSAQSASAAKTAPPPGADKPAESGFVRWNELVAGKSHFKLYGFLRLDAIYDSSRPNNTQIPAFIRSEDPAAPAAIRSDRNDDDLTIHPRLTRFGIDFTGPEIERLGGAKTSGKAEIDFYNLPSSESRNAPRMRHAYLKLTWDTASLLAGQTSDIISPIFPIVNPDFVMWGAGNVGDRRPQLRGEFAPKVGPGNFILQGEAGLTSANDGQDLDPAAAGAFRDGEASGKPTLQARAAYAFPLWQNQKFEIGVWGHRAWESTDTPIGTSGERDFDSEAAGLDIVVPLCRDIVWLKGEVWTGKNLSDIRGGILQGINTATGREVDSQGGWLELGVRPVKWFSLHGGYSFDNPDNEDLRGSAIPPRTRNSIWYGALRAYFDPIEIGLDYLNWTTDYLGVGSGHDHRFQSYISYKF